MNIGGHIRRSFLAALCVLMLAGCDAYNNLQGPMALGVVDGELAIVVCEPIEADELFAHYRESAGSGEWRYFWGASGGASILGGSVITQGELENRFSNVKVNEVPRLSSESGISVSVGSKGEGRNFVASFDLDGTALEESSWRHPDGSSTAEPCP